MIKLPAYFTRFGSKADGSASLGFATQELTSADFAILKENLNAFGWLIFSENASVNDIPEEQPEEEDITPSERLRNRMFVYFKEKKIIGDFNTWRKGQLETIGQRYLEKIN